MRNFVQTLFSNLAIDALILFVGRLDLMQNFSPRLRREYDPFGSPICMFERLKIALLCG